MMGGGMWLCEKSKKFVLFLYEYGTILFLFLFRDMWIWLGRGLKFFLVNILWPIVRFFLWDMWKAVGLWVWNTGGPLFLNALKVFFTFIFYDIWVWLGKALKFLFVDMWIWILNSLPGVFKALKVFFKFIFIDMWFPIGRFLRY